MKSTSKSTSKIKKIKKIKKIIIINHHHHHHHHHHQPSIFINHQSSSSTPATLLHRLHRLQHPLPPPTHYISFRHFRPLRLFPSSPLPRSAPSCDTKQVLSLRRPSERRTHAPSPTGSNCSCGGDLRQGANLNVFPCSPHGTLLWRSSFVPAPTVAGSH